MVNTPACYRVHLLSGSITILIVPKKPATTFCSQVYFEFLPVFLHVCSSHTLPCTNLSSFNIVARILDIFVVLYIYILHCKFNIISNRVSGSKFL